MRDKLLIGDASPSWTEEIASAAKRILPKISVLKTDDKDGTLKALKDNIDSLLSMIIDTDTYNEDIGEIIAQAAKEAGVSKVAILSATVVNRQKMAELNNLGIDVFLKHNGLNFLENFLKN